VFVIVVIVKIIQQVIVNNYLVNNIKIMLEKNKINLILFILIAFLLIASFNLFLNYKRFSIERETFLGNLLYQYYFELQSCIDSISENSELSEEKCIEKINQTNLAEKIEKYGGAEYLETISDEKKK